MFTGKSNCLIDTKKRMSIPAEHRDKLGNKLYIGVGFDDNYISIYPPEKFQKFVDTLMQEQIDNWDILTTFSSSMGQIPMDSQGRITLPAELAEQFGLEREIVIVGAIDHLQIWNPDKWESYITDQRKVSLKERYKKSAK